MAICGPGGGAPSLILLDGDYNSSGVQSEKRTLENEYLILGQRAILRNMSKR